MSIKIITINQKHEGSYYPNTKVQFIKRKVNSENGNRIEGVFADFKYYSIFNLKLPEFLCQSTDLEQFDYCLNQLKAFYKFNPKRLEEKLKEQYHLLIDNNNQYV